MHRGLPAGHWRHCVTCADAFVSCLNNINKRVARLLKGRWADTATGFLRVESISGRNITFHTVDAGVSGYEPHSFTVTVSPEGTLSLAKQPQTRD